MRIALRVMGLDLFELTVNTDGLPEDGPGDATSNPVGFSLPERPAEYELPER